MIKNSYFEKDMQDIHNFGWDDTNRFHTIPYHRIKSDILIYIVQLIKLINTSKFCKNFIQLFAFYFGLKKTMVWSLRYEYDPTQNHNFALNLFLWTNGQIAEDLVP